MLPIVRPYEYLIIQKIAEGAGKSVLNGVETIPSILRRKYHVDDMPVRGRLKTKVLFGFKMLALNFSKLWLYERGLEKCRPLQPENA